MSEVTTTEPYEWSGYAAAGTRFEADVAALPEGDGR